MGFTTVDYVIVIAYLVGVAVLGVVSGGKQTSTRDYFLGRKDIPWWAVCFAIVATETSTLTFISIPGLAYATNLGFLQVTFGYLLGRIVISAILLPAYAKGDLTTAYQLLAQRFGPTMRTIASITFMLRASWPMGCGCLQPQFPLRSFSKDGRHSPLYPTNMSTSFRSLHWRLLRSSIHTQGECGQLSGLMLSKCLSTWVEPLVQLL